MYLTRLFFIRTTEEQVTGDIVTSSKEVHDVNEESSDMPHKDEELKNEISSTSE